MYENGWYKNMFYDRQGKEISLVQYAELQKFAPYYSGVERTDMDDGFTVSTIWLGVNWQFLNGPPLIFETALFAGHDQVEVIARYSTEIDAIIGHKFWCQSIAEGWERVTDETLGGQGD